MPPPEKPAGAGSSPLTRGKPHRRVPDRTRPGLIPAHAGKTRRDARTHAPHEAHPRSRGENRFVRDLRVHPCGSSPLTRGKPRADYRRLSGRGLIPAHAGKTGPPSSWAMLDEAHPRSRGENVLPRLPSALLAGSSPLTRGKRAACSSVRRARRLIPAHAGKTSKPGAAKSAAKAHPRSRGENAGAAMSASRTSGSSPLTRGKRAPFCV